MACILHIETATEVCSVAVSKDGEIIFSKEETKGPSHAVLLGVFVNEAMKKLHSLNITLDAIAISCGPGSYTGLRIGVSEAKGLCYGLDIPLIAINTLHIMAYGVLQKYTFDKNTLLCPMIDARRMEVYDTLFDNELNMVGEIRADIIENTSFDDILQNKKIAFFGNGSAKCKDVLPIVNTIFLEDVYPKASDMIALSEELYQRQDFVDVAYFEPFYLKEFVATIPKNKVLGSK
jgi:tRNA threonylcarbamoyladenosine biosynthesis protein TsaB